MTNSASAVFSGVSTGPGTWSGIRDSIRPSPGEAYPYQDAEAILEATREGLSPELCRKIALSICEGFWKLSCKSLEGSNGPLNPNQFESAFNLLKALADTPNQETTLGLVPLVKDDLLKSAQSVTAGNWMAKWNLLV